LIRTVDANLIPGACAHAIPQGPRADRAAVAVLISIMNIQGSELSRILSTAARALHCTSHPTPS
jgi:hypothetical protein